MKEVDIETKTKIVSHLPIIYVECANIENINGHKNTAVELMKVFRK